MKIKRVFPILFVFFTLAANSQAGILRGSPIKHKHMLSSGRVRLCSQIDGVCAWSLS